MYMSVRCTWYRHQYCNISQALTSLSLSTVTQSSSAFNSLAITICLSIVMCVTHGHSRTVIIQVFAYYYRVQYIFIIIYILNLTTFSSPASSLCSFHYILMTEHFAHLSQSVHSLTNSQNCLSFLWSYIVDQFSLTPPQYKWLYSVCARRSYSYCLVSHFGLFMLLLFCAFLNKFPSCTQGQHT